MQPIDGRFVAALLDEVAAAAADGAIRVVVDFTTFDERSPFIEQCCEHANQARFRLPAEAEKNKVMTRKNGIDYLRYDRIFVSDYSREQLLAALNAAD
jgi:hypothetical protein